MPATVVYAGPTISPEEIRAVVPGARVRPPVARNDLFTEDWTPGDTAVVLDGYYRERLSVGHKEILWLLAEGVRVIGAASLGALRAAELGPYGMRGVGEVFRLYAAGEIDGDDEVAVLHGPAEVGYPPGTVALVNLRHGCREGARTGLVPEAVGARVLAAAKARPFTHRTWDELAEDLPGEGVRDALRTLRRMIAAGDWDLKHLDALAALRAARDPGPAAPAAGPGDAALTGITRNEALRWRSRREYAPGRWMSDLDVLTAARLFDDDYPRLHEETLTALLAGFAAARGLTLEEYARATLGVAAELPGPLAAWLTEEERATLPMGDRLRLVMVRVWPIWRSADWRPAVLARTRGTERWERWTGLVERADEAAGQSRGRLVVPPPEFCGRLFLRHWPGTPPRLAMARRGFLGVEDLGHAAARFFALDVRRRPGS
ncbi:TfuA domain-containing protein [Actinomadura sp. ATCC 31491]|uniref:TfuA domain-containing protein n=1 Tax=Actinomadura luzonensis TaxID=2805427 RepID=A0ABT0G709_9ACTN|nr:TfuA domain-containing protein [Actinomadura luzonensis]MCK2220391.1 TfuA domain-containing protein [Actinomadura luzonensis]